MPRYTAKWADVPRNLKLKSSLDKLGLKLTEGQPVAALFSGPSGTFRLYDTNQCVKKHTRKEQA